MEMYDFKIMKCIEVNYVEVLSEGFLIRLPLIHEKYIKSCVVDRHSVKSSYVRDIAFDTNVVYKSCQIRGFEVDHDELLVYYVFDHFIGNSAEYTRNRRECKLNELL